MPLILLELDFKKNVSLRSFFSANCPWWLTHKKFFLPQQFKGLKLTPGARSIIPSSHFHCPLPLTHQKNLGPIKGQRGHISWQSYFPSFLLPSTYFLFPSYYSPPQFSLSLFSCSLIQIHTITQTRLGFLCPSHPLVNLFVTAL